MKKSFFLIIITLCLSTISFSQTITDVLNDHTNFIKYNKLNTANLKNEKSPFPVIVFATGFDQALDTNYCIDPHWGNYLGVKKVGPFNNSGNLWQIGKPLKPHPLDTTFALPNALLTDTVSPYPINSNSSFELHFGREPGYENVCWSYMNFYFLYRILADTARDGMFVEIMYNGSNQWKNIILDTMADIIDTNFYSSYKPTDTLFNGESGISFQNQISMDQGWNAFSIAWFWNNVNAHLVDSVAFRITFISDSINTNKGGVLIDAINMYVEDWCNVGINQNTIKNNVYLYPNPLSKTSVIELPDISRYEFSIYDVTGNKVLGKQYYGNTIPLNEINLNSGLYYYTINSNNNCYNGKFIVNH